MRFTQDILDQLTRSGERVLDARRRIQDSSAEDHEMGTTCRCIACSRYLELKARRDSIFGDYAEYIVAYVTLAELEKEKLEGNE